METRPEWSRRVAALVGSRVAMYRARQVVENTPDGPRLTEPLTLQALSDRCAGLGYPIARSVLSKLEKGHRHSVTVDEVMVLALALEVPPPLLMFPFGQKPIAEVAPDRWTDTMTAVAWLGGFAELARQDAAGVLVSRQPAPEGDLALYRAHSAAVDGLWQARAIESSARSRLAELEAQPDAPEPELSDQRAVLAVAESARALENTIRMTRSRLAERGLLLPPLPSWLAGLGEQEGATSQ
jgi:hypothetical protein